MQVTLLNHAKRSRRGLWVTLLVGLCWGSSPQSALAQQPKLPGNAAAAGTASPDTLSLTLAQAEQQFLERNYSILAQRFNVSIAQAAVQQALLRDNPNIFLLNNLYNPVSGKFFPFNFTNGYNPDPANVGANGESAANTVNLQVQQLFNLTGARRKAGDAAQANAQVQQALFEDAVRQGHNQLAQTFYNVLAERRRLALLLAERQQVTQLLTGTREQLRLGVVPGFDVTRLELELQTLETQRLDQLNQLSQDESTLRVFVATPGSTFIAPVGEPDLPEAPTSIPALADLQAQALEHRPDLLAAQRNTVYADQNLRLQRALATPKLAVGVNYANQGNAYPNFYGVQAGIDVPVFNRNQGNIASARYTIQQNGFQLGQAKIQVEQDVVQAYEQVQRATALRKSLTPAYLTNIQNVSRDATSDFNHRLIGLVDYIDKIRAYRDAQLSLIDISTRLQQARQQLNFVTNTPVFP